MTSDPFLSDIFAPTVVAVPPADAVFDLCRTADGEIRHYGWRMLGGAKRRVYIASRDEGLSWKTFLASDGEAGAMEKSPESGDWIGFEKGPTDSGEGLASLYLLRSKTGPGDPAPLRERLPWNGHFARQFIHLQSRNRWVAALSDTRCENGSGYRAAVALSDDDGRTWRRVQIPPARDVKRLLPGDRRPRWFCDGCEPTIAELADGTLLMAVRTSGPHHAFFTSRDGGETWDGGDGDPAFWATNTMPYFFRLSDGRLLFFWNNTTPLPTRDPAETPELGDDELSGQWESVFTNRDALHTAISDDDGRTWRGFREIALCDIRNASDFRELGNDPAQELDKSVHQTQALELSGGKVLLAYGQNRVARRLAIFDPDWLLETSREDDFRTGLGGLSNHLYVRSLSGGWRRWAGHCAWNRMPGATLVRDPDTDAPPPGSERSVREVLQLARVHDPRLVSERQGVVWNFPAAQHGIVTVECRIVGAGFRMTLSDHWINPCDETAAGQSPFSRAISRADLPDDGWHALLVEWDEDAGTVDLRIDGRLSASGILAARPRFGLSYLHLQTLAESADPEGTYIRRLTATANLRLAVVASKLCRKPPFRDSQ